MIARVFGTVLGADDLAQPAYSEVDTLRLAL
jgi:hypothetical protein